MENSVGQCWPKLIFLECLSAHSLKILLYKNPYCLTCDSNPPCPHWITSALAHSTYLTILCPPNWICFHLFQEALIILLSSFAICYLKFLEYSLLLWSCHTHIHTSDSSLIVHWYQCTLKSLNLSWETLFALFPDCISHFLNSTSSHSVRGSLSSFTVPCYLLP